MVNIKRATSKEEILKIAEKDLENGCGDCWHCCKFGTGYFLGGDINKISKSLKMKKEDFIKEYLQEYEIFNTKVHKAKMIKKKLPHGRCIFVDHKGECTIHDFKPLHCRVGTCREHGEAISIWFALNYLVNENDPESVRQWAQYLNSHPTIEGGKLQDLVPDRERLKKILSYEEFK